MDNPNRPDAVVFERLRGTINVPVMLETIGIEHESFGGQPAWPIETKLMKGECLSWMGTASTSDRSTCMYTHLEL